MSKTRRTVSLEEEVDEYLSRPGTNASELVNELVKQHMNGGASTDEILNFRIQQVESEVENIAGQLERKEEELTELRERKQQNKSEEEEERMSAIENAARGLMVEEMQSTGPFVAEEESHVKKEAERVGTDIATLQDIAIQMYRGEYDD